MDNNIKTVIKNSKAKAEKLVSSTAKIRKIYAVGRPNSARKSTAVGALKAFSVIISKFNPGYTTR
jgi:hypothetical protein